ncbi:putative copper-transporting ATPase HMA5 [Platanthera guangdongensis]|uniref:Copper-transporting ATPase HMA5 n=1 Tax=Platanthera guangdongensis TaxID=2320717 RepID=A0ABR2MTL2_9ASPA
MAASLFRWLGCPASMSAATAAVIAASSASALAAVAVPQAQSPPAAVLAIDLRKVLSPIKPRNYQLPDDRTSFFVLGSKSPSRKCEFDETSTPLHKFKAKAIVEHAKKFKEEEEYVAWAEARDFISITSHGVKAIIRNKELVVGNKSLMLDTDIQIPDQALDLLLKAEEMAQSGILVVINSDILGLIMIFDPLKPSAKEVISILKSMNVRSIMVTRDNWGTAKAIAHEFGIDMIVAKVKPEEKDEKVKELQLLHYGTSVSLSLQYHFSYSARVIFH